MWDSIKSAGRSKVRKKTNILAWKVFADKCANIIDEFCKNDKNGIPQYLLLMKSEYSLWTFKKYVPLMLEQYNRIIYDKKKKRYKVSEPLFE